MNISKLTITGFKCFENDFTISFCNGLTLLIGENGSGKSAIIDALRLILQEDEFGRRGISEGDFYRNFNTGATAKDGFKINLEFENLTPIEKIAYLPWNDLSGHASLSLAVENKQDYKGRYKWSLWGGASKASAFERELFDSINCIYLPPLRDAEVKLRAGRGSRLARLLKNMSSKEIDTMKKEGKEHPLVIQTKEYNNKIIKDTELVVHKASELIRLRLSEALGNTFRQDTSIQFTQPDFNRIVENLCLLFFPFGSQNDRDLFRSLEENSLGYNNLIYLATVLAELCTIPNDFVGYNILLIEEPEAHLHPQLQVRLLDYLKKRCLNENLQVIVTSHSTVLAAATNLNSITCLTKNYTGKIVCTRISECNISEPSFSFIDRWLDSTKSTLLFAKGIILVEGIAEALLIPELAKRTFNFFNILIKKKNSTSQNTKYYEFPLDLSEAGISVINMGGIYFKHFIKLFCKLDGETGLNIPVRCAGITDRDPAISEKIKNENGDEIEKNIIPIKKGVYEGTNHALPLVSNTKSTEWVRVYANDLKTFEYDLAMESGNLKIMAKVLQDLWPSKTGTVYKYLEDVANKNWNNPNDLEKRGEAAYKLLCWIEDDDVGKGLYAQKLATELGKKETEFVVPKYIRNAILWACGGVKKCP